MSELRPVSSRFIPGAMLEELCLRSVMVRADLCVPPVACKPDPGQTQVRPHDGLQSTIVASFENLQTTARSIVQSESLIIR